MQSKKGPPKNKGRQFESDTSTVPKYWLIPERDHLGNVYQFVAPASSHEAHVALCSA